MSLDAIEIRRAGPHDAQAIEQVHDSAWRNAYRGLIPGRELERMVERRGSRWWSGALRGRSQVAVLTFGGVIAGYAGYGRNRAADLPYASEIYELYLRPEYQGLGFGTRLFTTVRRELSSHGRGNLLVWVLADNERACRFYTALGGAQVEASLEMFGRTPLTKIAFGWPAPN